MAALIFVIVWYFGNPIFSHRGFSEKQLFFSALTAGVLFEVAIFAITGTTGYGIVINLEHVHGETRAWPMQEFQ